MLRLAIPGVLALAAVAAGCSVGSLSGLEATGAAAASSFWVGGEVSGLAGELVLGDANQTQLTIEADGPFTMPAPYLVGSTYDIGVVRSSPLQVCSVINGRGIVPAGDVTQVQVTCLPSGSFPLSLTVDGLVGGAQLGVGDGGGQQLLGNGQGQVGDLRPAGAAFSLALVQPAGHVCAVKAGSALSGRMPAGPLSVAVTCVPQSYPVAFDAAGLLPGTQVQVQGAGWQTLTLTSAAAQGAWPAPATFGESLEASLTNITSGVGCTFSDGQTTWQAVQGAQAMVVSISCAPTYKLAGTVAGAYADTPLSLALGDATYIVAAGQTTFSFADALQTQENWSLQVSPQPAGQRCQALPAAGTQTAADVQVTVTCAPFLALSQGQAATQVMGQNNFVDNGGGGGLTGWNENYTNPVVGTDGVVSVVNSDAGRVLFFSSLPTAPGAAASFVIDGINDFAHASATNATTFAVVRLTANLVEFFQPLPRANGATPAFALGGDTSCSATGFDNASDIFIYGNTMALVSSDQSRVLVWHSIPTGPGATPDVVLGQPDMVSCNSSTSAQGLSGASGVWFNDKLTAIVSPNDRRLLLYKHGIASLTSGQAADVVLGSVDFNTAGGGGPSLADFQPDKVTSNGTQLFATDPGNNRVLVWNSIPTTNHQPADLVLGQADSTSNSCNRGGSAAANTLCRPYGLAVTRQALLINDYANHRVLIYNTP